MWLERENVAVGCALDGWIERQLVWTVDDEEPLRAALLEGAHGFQGGHAFSAPAAQVRHQRVAAQVKLGLVQNDPAARATATAIKGSVELASQGRACPSVLRGRPGARHELAV